MRKHTPGPWVANKDPDSFRENDWAIGLTEGKIDEIAVCDKNNAMIISAAPDILSEMNRYLPVIEYLERKPELWGEIAYPLGIATANGYRHAIAKATGESA